jgi:SAM-dependent methyltransferase
MGYSEIVSKDRVGIPVDRGPEFAYLCVDAFMQDIFSARALATAFESGLIDFLLREPQPSPEALARRTGLDKEGLVLLLGLLKKSQVLRQGDSGLQLTEEFRRALDFRDLLELKLSTANFGAHDLLDHFTEMIRHPRQSIGNLDFCSLFAYEKGLHNAPENYEFTKRWMQITSGLTRYEAPVCMKYHDFGRYSHVLDVGGNSGEFLLQLCRRHLQLKGTVFDLPVVCRVGREHVAGRPEAARITFVEGDALHSRLPSGFDLVSFKSMLHDWPNEQARLLLVNASEALRPGGTLLIFERAPFEPTDGSLAFSMIPFLLFFGAFRSSTLYEEQLERLGFSGIEARSIELEMPFHLITARKGR